MSVRNIRVKRCRIGDHAGEFMAKAYGLTFYGGHPITLIEKIKSL